VASYRRPANRYARSDGAPRARYTHASAHGLANRLADGYRHADGYRVSDGHPVTDARIDAYADRHLDALPLAHNGGGYADALRL
jgi:hypothetical protein